VSPFREGWNEEREKYACFIDFSTRRLVDSRSAAFDQVVMTTGSFSEREAAM
jgi:hypothetical protein